MTFTQWTPEPWTLTPSGNIIQTHHVTRDVWVIPHEAGDMARIVACVNACAGVREPAAFVKAAREEAARHADCHDDGRCPCALCDHVRVPGAATP